MLFKELLKAVEVRATGDANPELTGITHDSRQVKPGFLFIAVEGLKSDGHAYIEQAVQRGAAAVVAEREVRLPPGLAWALVPDTRRALGLLAAGFYGNPSSKMKIIGVTGTNGKTTTTNLLAAILGTAGLKVGLIGTIENRIGNVTLPVTHTTPESTELQQLLARMAEEGVGACVMEVSSHALALHRVEGCEFDVGVFTNLTQDHLDFHRNMENYLEAKLKLFRGLAAAGRKKDAGYAVINADDPYAEYFTRTAGGIVCAYGIKSRAEVWAEDISVSARGVSFTVHGKWGSFPLDLKLTGLFNVYNALGAFTAAAALGVPGEVIKGSLESVGGVPGRFERVDLGQEYTVIVDYAHTPDGLENILKTARRIAEGRLITVFGCGGDRDRTKRPLMGGIAAIYSDYFVLTSDNPRTEDPLKIIGEIEEGLGSAAVGTYAVEPDRRRAIRLAVEMAGRGDVVVIAGKGHEDYQIVGTSKHPFDDRLEAAKAIRDVRLGKSKA